MKVKILHSGLYANFLTMPKLSAQNLQAGDEIDFPDYYAEDIVASGLAGKVVPDAPLETPVEEPEVKKARRGRHPRAEAQSAVSLEHLNLEHLSEEK